MSAAIKALSYRQYDKVPEETKQGFVHYTGTAMDYHFWLFKTELKMKTVKADDYPEAMSRLIEALRGDALTIAMEIGTDALINPDRKGIDLLKTKIKEHVFPVIKEEVKTLYREGHREGGGILSRQRGEPMANYIERRNVGTKRSKASTTL